MGRTSPQGREVSHYDWLTQLRQHLPGCQYHIVSSQACSMTTGCGLAPHAGLAGGHCQFLFSLLSECVVHHRLAACSRCKRQPSRQGANGTIACPGQFYRTSTNSVRRQRHHWGGPRTDVTPLLECPSSVLCLVGEWFELLCARSFLATYVPDPYSQFSAARPLTGCVH